MGAANGSLGGIAVIEEVTYGTTPGTPTWIWQHPMPSTLGLRRQTNEPNILSYASHTNRGYAGKWVDGDLVVGLGNTAAGTDIDDALMGPIFGLAGAYDTDHWVLAGGDEPDVNSLSVLMSYGGGGASPGNNFEMINTGVKANAVRINLDPESNSYVTLVGIGQNETLSAGGTAETPAAPAETRLFMPSDAGTCTILTKVVCLYSAVFEALVPKTGFERRCMGGTMKQPITGGRPDCTWTLNLDLDDEVGVNETGTILSAWLTGAGETLGDITIGTDFTLKDCIISGETPPLQQGQIDYTLTGHCSSIEVYTA